MKVLVADDALPLRMTLSKMLSHWGFEAVLAEDGDSAWEILNGEDAPNIAILDWEMPGLSGIDICHKLQESQTHNVYTILLTAKSTRIAMLEALSKGANDFLIKPPDPDELHFRLNSAKKLIDANQQIDLYQQEISTLANKIKYSGELKNPQNFKHFTTASNKMRNIFTYIESIAKTGEPVLILGDTGTGKELVARAVHNASELSGEFVAVNIAAYREPTLLYSALFGHTKGAFTGATADNPGFTQRAKGGTLFLDEIGDMPLDAQAALLRVIQERQYFPLGSNSPKPLDARIVVATHRNIKNDDGFRQDLYFRLKLHLVKLPPLSERKEDIPLLLERFAELGSERLGISTPRIDRDVAPFLSTYNYPGNVRELEMMVYNAIATSPEGIKIDSFSADFPSIGEHVITSDSLVVFPQQDLPPFSEITDLLISEALERSSGNQAQAARLLGMSRSSLNYHLNAKKRQKS